MASFTTRLATMTWGGTGNNFLVQDDASNKSSPSTFTVTMEGPDQDTTAFAAAGVTFNTAIPGIRSWSVEITTRMNAAIIGNTAFITFADGFVLNSRQWSMTLDTPANETTAFNSSTPVLWRTFVPGLTAWSGSYEGHLDDTTPMLPPSLDNAGAYEGPASATFVLQNASVDTSLAGSIFATRASSDVRIGEVARYAYDYRGTGALTWAGGTTYGSLWFADGAIIYPNTGSLVLTATTGRTFTGDAFRTGMTINCAVDGVITATVRAQGTGALTIA